MAKKKGFKSVVITILVTLIVLAALTYVAFKYLLPKYDESSNEIYQIAVKFFPLLVGFVLIVIGSMIASGKDEEEDEEDKLPPNAYEQQLFEQPSDDPTRTKDNAQVVPAPTAAPETKDEAQFVSIFDTPDESVFEEEAPAETEEEASAEEIAEPVEDVKEAKPVAAGYDPLLAAIEKLSDKFDDFTQALTCDDEYYDYEDEEDEEEPVSGCTYCGHLEEKVDNLADVVDELVDIVSSGKKSEEPKTVASGTDAALVAALTAIANRLENAPVASPAPVTVVPSAAPVAAAAVPSYDFDKRFQELTASIQTLATLVANNQVAPAPAAPVSVEVEQTAPVIEEKVEPVSEPTPAPAPVEAPAPQNEVEEEDDEPLLVEFECSEAEARAQEEFESAKDMGYDVSFAFVDANVDDIALNLGECGSAFECKGKTLVILPFLSQDEASAELDKLGAEYEIQTIAAGDKADFEALIASKIR